MRDRHRKSLIKRVRYDTELVSINTNLHFYANEPCLSAGFICSTTGSDHVITCTTRRWVVSGQLYCSQLPPAENRREVCKPFTDPTSRITNVRINRAAAHRSRRPFGIFFVKTSLHRLDVQKVRLRRRASSWRKIRPKDGASGTPPPTNAYRGCAERGADGYIYSIPRLREKCCQFSSSSSAMSCSMKRS